MQTYPEWADTMPVDHTVSEPRQRDPLGIDPYGAGGLLIFAASAVLVCWAVVQLLVWWLA